MKKIFNLFVNFLGAAFGIAVIFYVFWPMAESYIYAEEGVGDGVTHLANIVSVKIHNTFPVMSWQGEWFAGYPAVEGYPWLHYYLIQPILSFFQSPGLAMDYYAAVFLLLYYITSFILLFYVSKNVFIALFFGLLLIFGADSNMSLFVNAFVVFTGSQFLLPLILLITIIAREKESPKLFIISSLLLTLSFYAHASMTAIVIIPIILPFLLINKVGNITRESLTTTVSYFLVFGFLSCIQIYQYLVYSFQGSNVTSVEPTPIKDIIPRYLFMFSWQNPALFVLLIIFIPLLIWVIWKKFKIIKPYLFSFLMIFFFFSLMVLKITGMVVILLAERAIWGVSLTFLVLFAATIKEMVNMKLGRSIVAGLLGLSAAAVYLYFTVLVKTPLLVPDIKKPYDQYNYSASLETGGPILETPYKGTDKSKYDLIQSYPRVSWNNEFDNYRTDGISYNIYSSWSLRSASTSRFKGRYPGAKGLPLDWSGLVSAAEYGRLGEAGALDNSKLAINQSLFFFDWYAIKHFEIGKGDPDLAGYLRTEPLITSVENSSNIEFNSLDNKFVGPMYSATNAKTIAVVSPQIQYDNFIRTLSYSEFTSQKIIPIYMGSSLGSLNAKNLKYFDAVFVYGYKKPLFSTSKWNELSSYVKESGNLIIETGQKVGETQSIGLPEVFPVQKTKLIVIDGTWSLGVNENELTQGVLPEDFSPLKTKYLPFAVSETKPADIKGWAKPVLTKDESVVMAYGELEKGKVVWSGINLPFHAIDNKNFSETMIFANILKWFFPDEVKVVSNFSVDHPRSEIIRVDSESGRGFLIKENYNSGWIAKLNGKRVKIYKAGLFEMYVPFEEGVNKNSLELRYYGSPVHWLLFAVTSASSLGVLGYLLFNINCLAFLKIKTDKILDKEED